MKLNLFLFVFAAESSLAKETDLRLPQPEAGISQKANPDTSLASTPSKEAKVHTPPALAPGPTPNTTAKEDPGTSMASTPSMEATVPALPAPTPSPTPSKPPGETCPLESATVPQLRYPKEIAVPIPPAPTPHPIQSKTTGETCPLELVPAPQLSYPVAIPGCSYSCPELLRALQNPEVGASGPQGKQVLAYKQETRQQKTRGGRNKRKAEDEGIKEPSKDKVKKATYDRVSRLHKKDSDARRLQKLKEQLEV